MLLINVEQIDAIIVMELEGTLTRETLEQADEAWLEQLAKKPLVLALDFSRLGQVDSISINHLFKLSRATEESGIKLVILDVFGPLMKIFEVIRLDRVITILSKKKFETDYLKKI
jgi:anti-anti-sigma factor